MFSREAAGRYLLIYMLTAAHLMTSSYSSGPSSMRLVEAMGCGAIPVLLDDWSTPFGSTLPFAVRWSLRHGDLDILVDVLQRMAADKAEVRRRLLQMHAFMAAYHPIWRSARFLYTVLAEDVDADRLC